MSGTKASELRILLYPNDYALSHLFYLKNMAWKIKHEWDYGDSKGTMFDTGCGVIEILWPNDIGATVGNYILSFHVANVWSLWDKLSKKVPVVFALRQNPWGDDSFCISDPDGNRLTFFTYRALKKN